jgi:ribosomal protein S18 acetylase RimI-like enzyme
MLISLLSWNHYAQCRALFEDVFDLSELSWFVAAWRKRSDHSRVALHQGIAIGFALIDTSSTLHYVCVHPDFQNSGLGTRLLTSVLECEDARSTWLSTAGDDRLVAWYMRHGFKVAKRVIHQGKFIGAHMVLRRRCRSVSINAV